MTKNNICPFKRLFPSNIVFQLYKYSLLKGQIKTCRIRGLIIIGRTIVIMNKKTMFVHLKDYFWWKQRLNYIKDNKVEIKDKYKD